MFDYSTLEIGDAVDVSTQADFANPVAGVVAEVTGETCSIQVLGSQDRPLEFCWHVDDPRLEAGPEQFDKNQALYTGEGEVPPRTGVFRQSRNQTLIEALPERLAAIERMLNGLVVRVGTLEEGGNEAPEPRPARRKPGRPRKPPTEEAGADNEKEAVGVGAL